MKGEFAYLSVHDKIVEVNDSKLIPSNFKQLVKLKIDIPPPPHTDEEHRYIEEVQNEMFRIINQKRNQS